ncbi:MAG: NlpC/P60 family protein [Calditrichota bacterium]
MLSIPQYFLNVTYNAAHYPGAVHTDGLNGGANCQVFAYELLRYYGKTVPDLRSSNLWEDNVYTQSVTELQPLDLLLWNRTEKSWGAHVGVYVGDNSAIHLSKEIGLPVIWSLECFLEEERYAVFIGAKRVLG